MVNFSSDFKKLYPFKSLYFKLPCSNKIHYIDEGNPLNQNCIVLVHGNPSWSFLFRDLVKKLRKDFRVIAFDHIGCGLSSKPQKYTYCLNTHINNFDIFFKSLNIKKTHLIVHDWGGAIGLGWATRNISKLNRLVVSNSAAFRSKDIPKRIALCKSPILGPFLVRRLNAFAFPATFMASTKKLSKEVKRAYLLPYNSYNNRIAISKFVEDIPLSSSHKSYKTLYDIELQLKKLDSPVLFQWGMKDFCFHKKFLQRWLDFFPKAQVNTYMNAGHYVFEDEPNQTYENILRFLNKQ